MDGRNRETGKLLFSGTLSSRGEMIILIRWSPPDTRLSLAWVKLKINQKDKDKTVTYHDKHIGTGQDSHDDNVLVNVTT